MQANATEAAATGQPPINSFIVDEEPVIAVRRAQPRCTTSVPAPAFVPDGNACHIDGLRQGRQCRRVAGNPRAGRGDPGPRGLPLLPAAAGGFDPGGGERARLDAARVGPPGPWLSSSPRRSVVRSEWDKYLDTPTTAYYDRGYDGLGAVRPRGRPDRPAVRGLAAAAAGGRSPARTGAATSQALNMLMGSGPATPSTSTWGGSYFLDSAADATGTCRGPGPGPVRRVPSPTDVTIGNDDGQQHRAARPRTSPTRSPSRVTPTSWSSPWPRVTGGARPGLQAGQALDDTRRTALCLKQGGCTCPDGSPGASEHTTQATGPISVGPNGGDHTWPSTPRVLARPVLQEARSSASDRDPPPPGGGGGGGGGAPDPDPQQPTGTTQGDPHLTTFDGRYLRSAGRGRDGAGQVDDR